MPSATSNARDYNRSLAAPVRWAHVAVAVVRDTVSPITDWAFDTSRWWWAGVSLAAIVAAIIVFPFDALALEGAAVVLGNLGGDIRRELESVQQYGALGSLVLVSIVIYLQDPLRRNRLLDLFAAVVVGVLLVSVLKMIIGRPRPRMDQYGSSDFLGPFGQHPYPGEGMFHSWEIWGPISSDLHSMPSSHTAIAVVLSVFVAKTYPRLRGLAMAMVAIVGLCRVLFGAHYPSDVVIGAATGFVVGYPAVTNRWGQRAADRVFGGRSKPA